MATTTYTRSSSASKERTGATGGSTHSTLRSCATDRCPPTELGDWPPWKCSWQSKSPAGRVRKSFSNTRYLRSTSAVRRIMFQTFQRCGVNPIDWTAKRRNLEYRSNEFLGLILYSDSLRLAVFLAKEVLGRSSD